MKKILLILFITIILVGCGSKTKETICNGHLRDGQKVEDKIESKGDEVLKITTKYTYEIDEANKTDFIEECKQIAAEYKGIKGMTYSYQDKGKTIEEIYDIDYKNASITDLKAKQYLSTDFSRKDDYVSLKKTIEVFEKDDSKCK